MSIIRMGQESKYIECLDESMQYLYDSGNGIHDAGTYGQFIDALCKHASRAGFSESVVESLQQSLEEYHDAEREQAIAIGRKPEMAHALLQYIDSRFSDDELPGNLPPLEEMDEILNEYAEQEFNECAECGKDWRVALPGVDEDQDRCYDCLDQYYLNMDVSADVSNLREFVEDLPDDAPPKEEDDDDFFAACMEVFMEREGDERHALHHQLSEAADEVMDAVVENRPVDKDHIHSVLDGVAE